MIKFIKKMCLFVLIISCCLCGIVGFHYFVIGSQYEYNYQAALVDKVNRLESIEQPKIVLVGNSNVALGIESEAIEEAFGMPVVNCGLHGGLGNAFHEEIAKLNINAGDIIVVCHSTYADDDKIDDPSLAWITFNYKEEIWPVIREKDYKQMLLAYPDYLRSSYLLWIKGAGNIDSGGVYSRNSFNKYGDVVYRPKSAQMNTDEYFAVNPVQIPQVNDICATRLNELKQYVNERDAHLVIAGYPIAYGKYAEFTEADFVKFQMQLDEMLNCEIISDYTDYFYPYDYFYDTFLHLTEEGAELRTVQLISDLENWMKLTY